MSFPVETGNTMNCTKLKLIKNIITVLILTRSVIM